MRDETYGVIVGRKAKQGRGQMGCRTTILSQFPTQKFKSLLQVHAVPPDGATRRFLAQNSQPRKLRSPRAEFRVHFTCVTLSLQVAFAMLLKWSSRLHVFCSNIFGTDAAGNIEDEMASSLAFTLFQFESKRLGYSCDASGDPCS